MILIIWDYLIQDWPSHDSNKEKKILYHPMMLSLKNTSKDLLFGYVPPEGHKKVFI